MIYKTSNRKNTAAENAYILYMIGSDSFKKCICRSERMTEKLFLHYKEMSCYDQLKREYDIIKNLERITKEKKEVLSEMKSEAYVFPRGKGYQVIFKTGFEEIQAEVTEDGNYTIDLIG